MNRQYSNRSVIGLTTVAVIFVWVATWIFRPDEQTARHYFPVSMLPSYEMLWTGLILAPALGLLAFVSMMILLLRNPPRPLTSVLFLGFFSLVLFVEEPDLERQVLGMIFGSFAMLIESVSRRLSCHQILASLLAFCTSLAYFWTAICVYLLMGA